MTPATTVLLVRHAESEGVGHRLNGRLPGVVLTRRGQAQADALPARLHRVARRVDALYVSPQRRAFETAVPISRDYQLPLRRADLFAEVDFGDWTGASFDALEHDPAWRQYNAARSTAPIPHGESAIELQQRVEVALAGIVRAHPGGTITVITHAEIIRTAVLGCLGQSLDEFHTVAIEPASITAIRFRGGQREVLFVNAVETDGDSAHGGASRRATSAGPR